MSWNDENDLRKSGSIKLINKLEGNNRAAIVDFDSSAVIRQGLTTDKDQLINAINRIDSSGGTNISIGLAKAINALDMNSRSILTEESINFFYSNKTEETSLEEEQGTSLENEIDDIEIAICQVGRLLNFYIVEEYRIYNASKQKDSIIIKDIVDDDEFYDVENLKKRFLKLITNGKLKKEKWVDTTEQLKVANTKEDYKTIVDYGLNILKSLPSMLEEDYQKIEKKYFDMLLFDSIINQSERNFKDYGILCDKETKRYSFAPLFDNVFPSILKNNDVITINGITCNRYELIECLFYNYYDKIKDRVEEILQKKDRYLQNIDIILKYNLDLETYNMMINNIITNLNYFERLNKEQSMMKTNTNAGYVNIVQMIIGIIIIAAFSVCIGYLLYCIK